MGYPQLQKHYTPSITNWIETLARGTDVHADVMEAVSLLLQVLKRFLAFQRAKDAEEMGHDFLRRHHGASALQQMESALVATTILCTAKFIPLLDSIPAPAESLQLFAEVSEKIVELIGSEFCSFSEEINQLPESTTSLLLNYKAVCGTLTRVGAHVTCNHDIVQNFVDCGFDVFQEGIAFSGNQASNSIFMNLNRAVLKWRACKIPEPVPTCMTQLVLAVQNKNTQSMQLHKLNVAKKTAAGTAEVKCVIGEYAKLMYGTQDGQVAKGRETMTADKSLAQVVEWAAMPGGLLASCKGVAISRSREALKQVPYSLTRTPIGGSIIPKTIITQY